MYTVWVKVEGVAGMIGIESPDFSNSGASLLPPLSSIKARPVIPKDFNCGCGVGFDGSTVLDF